MAGDVHLNIPRTEPGDRRHQCPISGCTKLLPSSKLLCLVHWRKVPNGMQAEVRDAYDGGGGTGTARLARAQDAAIQAVERKLAATP